MNHFGLADDPAERRNRALREAAERLGMRDTDLDVFLRAGFREEDVPKGGQNRRSMLEYLKKKEAPPPKWVIISGMWPELEKSDTVEVRRKKIRALYKATVLLIRRELKRHQMDGFHDERTLFWDPVAEVCRELEVSQSKLSALCKELTGNSLIQTIDAIRAETVKGKLRRAIREFVSIQNNGTQNHDASGGKGLTTEASAHGACLGMETKAWEVWKALKASRRWPEFSQNGWAMGLGFASYRRLYRACQVVYGMTPHQLEMALIRECLDVRDGEDHSKEETSGRDPVEMGLEEIERSIRGLTAYDMLE